MDYFTHELDELRRGAGHRQLRVLEPVPGSSTEVEWHGRRVTTFCSNDYLGLSHHPRVCAAAEEALHSCGLGSGASRLVSGTTTWHERLEQRLAQFKRTEAALVFSSGFLANLGIVTALLDAQSLLVIDKLNHASIIDAARLSGATVRVYPHGNMNKCAALLEKRAAYNRALIVTDTIFSMDGDAAPLDELVRLKTRYDALLMVDEAHATGVFGERGSGLAEACGLDAAIDLAMGTLSKATGGLGGYVACSSILRDYLINKSRPFIYTTALPAPIAAAMCAALDVIEEERALRERLWMLTHTVKAALAALGAPPTTSTSPIIPVIIGEDAAAMRCADFLLEEGLLVPAIRPPTVPRGSARLRITISAAHRDDDIARLCAALKKWFQRT